jgi:hypothetical protein
VAVTVHDLVIHPRDRELVVGTHGRSVYVIDVAPLEELTAEIAGAPTQLFAVKPTVAYKLLPAGEPTKSFVAPNPPYGAVLAYRVADPAMLTIEDENGKVLARWVIGDRPGFNRVVWDLGIKSETGPVAPGTYRATLKTARDSKSQPVRILPETEPLVGSD